MATADIRCTLYINDLKYRSYPHAFQATVSEGTGPTPGAILVDTDGVDVDLSQLTAPGLYFIYCRSGDGPVDYGIRDVETNRFHRLNRLPVGEGYPGRLVPDFGLELSTGTGTVTTARDKFHIRATVGTAIVVLDIFGA